MTKKKDLSDWPIPPLPKDKTFDFHTYTTAPEKCSPVVVINHKYTYQGTILGHAKQDDVVKYVLVDSRTLWRGVRWESVHDVFEVER